MALTRAGTPRENIARSDSLRAALVESIGRKLGEPETVLSQFFRSNNPDEIADRLLTIRHQMSQALVAELPRSTRIKWAVNLPDRSLRPEYELSISPILHIERVSGEPDPDGGRAGFWSLELQGPLRLAYADTGIRQNADWVSTTRYYEFGKYEEILAQISATFAEALRVQLDDHFAGHR